MARDAAGPVGAVYGELSSVPKDALRSTFTGRPGPQSVHRASRSSSRRPGGHTPYKSSGNALLIQAKRGPRPVVSATAKAKAVAVPGVYREIPGISARVRFPSGAATRADAGNQLITLYTNLWYEQKRIRERRGHILAVGRRGALSTRQFTGPGPGRRGALATRPAPVASRTVSPGTAGRSAGKDAGRAAQGLPRGSTKSDTGRQGSVAPATRTTTGHAPAYQDLSRLAQTYLQQQTTAFASGAPARVRTPARVSEVELLSGGRLEGQVPGLTGLNSPGVSSRPPQGCNCPTSSSKKPPKKRCTNQVISRETRGDVRTTKVRLTCQQSKPKRP